MIEDYVLNSSPLEVIYKHHSQPKDEDYACDVFKNINYSHLGRKKISSYCLTILSIMYSSIQRYKKYQHVFIKIQDLKIGQNTSGTGLWHLDSSMLPVDDYENYIFTTGLYNTTEFFKTPITIQYSKTAIGVHKQVESKYESDRDSFILEPITIYKYNGSNAHRGRKVEVPEKRILIRLSNTDRKLTSY